MAALAVVVLGATTAVLVATPLLYFPCSATASLVCWWGKEAWSTRQVGAKRSLMVGPVVDPMAKPYLQAGVAVAPRCTGRAWAAKRRATPVTATIHTPSPLPLQLEAEVRPRLGEVAPVADLWERRRLGMRSAWEPLCSGQAKDKGLVEAGPCFRAALAASDPTITTVATAQVAAVVAVSMAVRAVAVIIESMVVVVALDL